LKINLYSLVPFMFRLAAFLGLVGLALATALIVWSGYEEVLNALKVAGWGIVWASLFHLVILVVSVTGWRALLGGRRPSLSFFVYLLWIRAAINNLMPVARIGGEVVSVRILIQHGVRKAQAVACTVVETTLSVIAVFLISIAGVVLFTLRISDQQTEWQLLLALLLSVPLIAGLLIVQKIGAFGLATRLFSLLFSDLWKKFSADTKRLDRAVRTMYRHGDRVFWCLMSQIAAWSMGAVEVWLCLYFLGHPLTLVECFMIEALIQAASSAAFVVPGALGVQEAGFILFGHWLGVSQEVAAALAIMRRCRDLILYVPGLVAWQIREGRLLLKKKKA
jgi:putative membrane protein